MLLAWTPHRTDACPASHVADFSAVAVRISTASFIRGPELIVDVVTLRDQARLRDFAPGGHERPAESVGAPPDIVLHDGRLSLCRELLVGVLEGQGDIFHQRAEESSDRFLPRECHEFSGAAAENPQLPFEENPCVMSSRRPLDLRGI